MERVHPDMIKPLNMWRIMRGQTEMFPFYPPGVLQVWLEHKARYKFASNFCNGLTLDIGCGTGYGKDILNLPDNHYIGIDIDYSAIRSARSLNKQRGSFSVGNVLMLPVPTHTFSTILSFETIEHISQECINQYFAEIKRVLKPNGVFLVSTPNREVFSPKTTLSAKPNLRHHSFEFSPLEFYGTLRQQFGSVQSFVQGSVSDEHVKNPSSTEARLLRLVELACGNLYAVTPYNPGESSHPRFLIGVCSNPFISGETEF